MARFGRRFPVPWHQPRAPKGLYSPTFAGSTDTEGAATIVPTYPIVGPGSTSTVGALTFTGAPTPTASLPTFDVWIAFNPTKSGTTLTTANTQALPSSGQSNAYWTNVSIYMRDFQTTSGRQHFLDRMEAGTLRMTVDGRLGYFLNSTSSGNNTGYVIAPKQPIAVTATWQGTTYNLFWGLISTVTEVDTDQVNVDLRIEASDLLKQLSLRYMNTPAFWATYAASTSALNWYRCSSPQTFVVTSASGNGTTVTYQCINAFVTGDTVTVSGLGTYSGASLNLTDQVVTSASGSQFTVSNKANGTSAGVGTAFRAISVDYIGNQQAYFIGQVSFPTYGAIIYDTSPCVDLATGSNTQTGYIRLPQWGSTQYGIDFWVLSNNFSNSTIMAGIESGTNVLLLQVSTTGTLTLNPSSGPTVDSHVKIDDGYWHHIGLVCNSAGNLTLYVDGAFYSLSSIGNLNGFTNVTGSIVYPQIGTLGILNSGGFYADEVVVSGNASLSTLETEVLNRYAAGSILQLPVNTSQASVTSGDRIAQILTLAGFGSISNGSISLQPNTFWINSHTGAWSGYSPSNGYVNTEPYYWDSPITGSTALDLILQICDTDIGVFFQDGSGAFHFYDQAFFGFWEWDPITAVSSTSSTLTFTTSNALSAGETVTVVGITPTAYNGTWTVATANSVQFTVTSSLNPAGNTNALGYVGAWHVNPYTPTGGQVWSDVTTPTDLSNNICPYVPHTLQVLRDDADVWSSVKITPQAGTDQIYENTAAEARWGYTTLVKAGTVPTALNYALSAAVYLGYLFQSALPRVGAVQLVSETDNGQSLLGMLSSPLWTVVEFKRTAPNASTSGTYPDAKGQIAANMVVEFVSFEFNADPGYLHATYVLDPYPVRS